MNVMRLAVAVVLLACPASAQTIDSLAAVVNITTEPEGAFLFLDSVLVGRSPLEGFQLAAGRHALRAIYPSVAEWRALTVKDTLELAPGDVVTKRYMMGTFVRIVTVPSGAVVAARDSALGITPYVYRSSEIGPAELSLRKDGYSDSTITVARSDATIRILLAANVQPSAGAATLGQLPATDPNAGGTWATYAAAISMIGFGVASAYLNFEANKNYDLYVATDDQKYLDATHRYDRAALWSLALTQVSFGVLAYLLLSE